MSNESRDKAIAEAKARTLARRYPGVSHVVVVAAEEPKEETGDYEPGAGEAPDIEPAPAPKVTKTTKKKTTTKKTTKK
jgi:hypothetical protein